MNSNFRFGISSWSYPWSIGVAKGPQPPVKMTAIELMQKAKEQGVNLVQIADNLPLEKLSGKELSELAEFSVKHKIDIEVGTKGIEVDHLLNFLGIAKKLGSPILRTLPALFGKKAEFDVVKRNILEVLPKFEEANVIIVLENTEAFHACEYVELMKSINHSHFRMCVDLANALGIMEGPEYVMEELLPYCGNYHFKDVEVTRSQTLMGFSVHGKPAGQGQIPLPLVLNKLTELQLFPSVILELWPPPQSNIEETMQLEDKWVGESITYLNTVLSTN
ncbi:MAG: sugar phosphate isomerase/epimerase [Bacteroidales bacterium]|nr:sugar phosphate isomerase/epimerase [Bacteroidales bacterium]